ncbi:MAG: hypothetical protein V4820_11590 [Pseudomonadota bacterium]
MNDEEFERLLELVYDQQARIDVLERALSIFMLGSSPDAALVVENWLREYNENRATSANPATADRMRRADLAAIRFSDVIAATLGEVRRRRRG